MAVSSRMSNPQACAKGMDGFSPLGFGKNKKRSELVRKNAFVQNWTRVTLAVPCFISGKAFTRTSHRVNE